MTGNFYADVLIGLTFLLIGACGAAMTLIFLDNFNRKH